MIVAATVKLQLAMTGGMDGNELVVTFPFTFIFVSMPISSFSPNWIIQTKRSELVIDPFPELGNVAEIL